MQYLTCYVFYLLLLVLFIVLFLVFSLYMYFKHVERSAHFYDDRLLLLVCLVSVVRHLCILVQSCTVDTTLFILCQHHYPQAHFCLQCLSVCWVNDTLIPSICVKGCLLNCCYLYLRDWARKENMWKCIVRTQAKVSFKNPIRTIIK